MQKSKIFIIFLFSILILITTHEASAQDFDLEFVLDVNSQTIPLPNIFKPNIDLSGRGFHRDNTWPQNLASPQTLEAWEKEIGFSGIYRLQYNLWQIGELAKDKELQEALLSNYENIIKKINASGGIVILDIFGTPSGLGRVLDKRSPPYDLRVFKNLIKSHIRRLSCEKRLNVWYELWTAPDLDDFFLGRKTDYLNMYRMVAESIKELSAESKLHIPLGAPALSWWFQNLEGNTIISSEESLIYELIKFCYAYRLPLDFISWHGFSTDPKVELTITRYNKTAVALIRDWLSYFHFEGNLPLIVDEWNYDRAMNVLPERKEASHIAASYIPARLKNMYEAGLDYQLYFSLEDFYHPKEGVIRNTGIFWFDPASSEDKGKAKSIYSVFRMLGSLAKEMFT
ncbi:MAG: hypothetical protein NC928_03355, partial [Candidatus Omnitrophica bacterium]|nr:hypothetical protein [Candidatus Omnitrophota bacterium]